MEEQSKNIKTTKKKKLAWWIKLIIYPIIILTMLDMFLIFSATPAMKRYIQRKLFEKTEGLFSVEFKRISFEISTRRIALEDFSLIADTAVYSKLVKNNKANAALYNIACQSIELRGVKVFKLIINNDLHAKTLKITDPIVELKRLPDKKQKQVSSRDFVHQDIYPAISKYINEIKINQLQLDNGKFLLNLRSRKNKATTHIGYITATLYDFLLNKDEFDKKERLFYSDDLQLQLSEYKVNLGDKIHMMYADTVKISAKYSSLKAINVGVEPINKSQSFLNKTKQNYIKLKTPIIEFYDFNISELYFGHNMTIKNINISNPEIKIVKKVTTTKIKDKVYEQERRLNLTRVLNKNLKSVKIDTFKIINAKLKYYLKNWETPPTYSAKSLNLQLNKFDLSKKSHNDYRKIFYSDNLQLSIDTFVGKLPDKVHTVLAKSMYASTKEKIFKAKSISVKPQLISNLHNSLNLYVPALSILGTDFNRLFHKKELSISSLNIASSTFNVRLKKRIVQYSTQHKKKKKRARKLFFKNIFVRNLKLSNSKFNIIKPKTDSTEQDFSGNIELSAKHFMLNDAILSNNESKLLLADKFDLKLSNYQQDLKDLQHIIVAQSAQISNMDSLIAIAGLQVYRKGKEEKIKWHTSKRVYDIDIGKARATGIDINKIISKKELVAQSVTVAKPNINIYKNIDINEQENVEKQSKPDSLETFRDFLQKFFKVVNINSLRLTKANIKIADFDSLNNEVPTLQTQLNLQIKDFNFADSIEADNSISYSENIQLSLNNFVHKTFGKNYHIKIKNAVFSSKDSLFKASIVRLFPDSLYENSASTTEFFTAYSPLIQSKSISIKELLDSNIINLGNITIANPALSLSKKHFIDSLPVIEKNVKKKKSAGFKRLVAKQINIVNGIFGITHHSKDNEELLTSSSFNMKINDVDIDSVSLKNPKTLISNLDFKITLINSHHQSFGQKNLFDVEYCKFDNKIKELNAKNIILKTKNNSNNKSLAVKRIDVKKMKLSKFELGEFIINKNLIINRLDMGRTNVTLSQSSSKSIKKQSKITDFNLYRKIHPLLNSININRIKNDSIKLQLISQKGFNVSKQFYNQISIDISGLLVDSLHQNDGRLLNADDITVHLKNYNTNLDNGVYNLYIKDLGVSTGQKAIFAKSLSINPNYTRREYANKFRKEFSINYLQVKDIMAQNVDLTRLANNKSFVSDKIIVDGLKFHNYKNKKYPLDSVAKIALPLELIWKSKHLINVDSVKITNSYFGHEIMMKNARQKGFLDFTKLNASISNLTNIPSVIKKNPYTKLKASAYFMGESLLTVSFDFPISSDIGEYRYSGNLDTFNMELINPFVENSFFVSIKSGKINQLYFDIIANEEYASGNLNMLYNNLKVDLINKKKSDSLKVEKRGLFSMVANSIVRNRNRRLRPISTIYFERNPYKSVFNYWALSVLSGIRNSLGFKSKQLKLRLKQERSYLKSLRIYNKRLKRWKQNKRRRKQAKIITPHN